MHMVADITLKQKYNKLGKFSKKNLNNIKLPYIVKDVYVLAAGHWNDTNITSESVVKSYAGTDFNSDNCSLFLNHEDYDADKWIGYVKDIRLKGDKWVGNLEIVDMDTAIKVEFGADFGVSPILAPLISNFDELEKDEMGFPIGEVRFDLFELLSFSIVPEQAMEPCKINEIEEFNKKTKTASKRFKAKPSKFSEVKEQKNNEDTKMTETNDKIEDIKKEEVATEEPVKEEVTEVKPAEKVEETKPVEEEKKEEIEDVPKEKQETKDVIDISGLVGALETLSDSSDDAEVKELAKKLSDKLRGGPKNVEVKEELEETKGELNDVLEKLDKASAKLNDAYTLLEEKDKIIGTYQDNIKALEKNVANFEEVENKKLMAKRAAWFSEILNNYCNFHSISKTDMSATKERLETMSDAALNMLNGDIKRAHFNNPKTEDIVTKNSAQLNEPVSQQQEVTYEQKMENLWDQLQ